MNDIHKDASAARPRWDGTRVLFEIAEGGQSIVCAISRGALQDIGERRFSKSAELLRCFAEARPRIEAIARSKLRARPESALGPVFIWADDVDEPLGHEADAASPAAPA